MNGIFSRYRKDKENLLAYTSYLQCLPNNSRFFARIQLVQTEMLIAFLKEGKISLEDMDRILQDGMPMIDDPQESLFVDMVHTAIAGSKCVIPGLFPDFVENLTIALTVAHLNLHLSQDKLRIVLFLLECSDIICKRMGYRTYENGNPNSEAFCFPNIADFAEHRNYIRFTNDEIKRSIEMFGMSQEDFSQLVLKLKSHEIRKDLEMYGYCPRVEYSPFYICQDNSYIVLSPAYLLHAAFHEIQKVMEQTNDCNFYDQVAQFVNKEACCLIKESGCIKQGCIDGVPYALFQFDTNKIAIIETAFYMGSYADGNIQEKIEAVVAEEYPNQILLHLMINLPWGSQLTCSEFLENSICLCLSELRTLSGHPQFSLLNLYYYNKDKKGYRFPPTNTDREIIAFYFDQKCTFYQDNMPSGYWAHPEFAQTLQYQQAKENDIHDVQTRNGGCLRISHYADIPSKIPIYSPYLHSESDFLICELTGARVYALCGTKEMEYMAIYREVVIGLLNWFYAIERRNKIRLFEQDLTLYIHVCGTGGVVIEKRSSHACILHVSLKPYEKIGIENIEPAIISECCRQLVQHRIMNPNVTKEMLDTMFAEIGLGRFIQLGYSDDPRVIRDQYTSIYHLSDRWEDVVLTEIADHFNRKGQDITLSRTEGVILLKEVIGYLQQEAIKQIKLFDTDILVEKLLKLHHGLIYWSALSEIRYQSMARAYEYVGATYENQQQYANEYAISKTLSQGIVEFVFMQSISIQNKEEGSEEMIDRLFALMHHILDFGCCLDSLLKDVHGAEIRILANGRIVYPRASIAIFNQYFGQLRKFKMERTDLLHKLYEAIPEYAIDFDSQNFADAFRDEFGFSIHKFTSVIQSTERYAERSGNYVAKMDEDIFRKLVIEDILNAEEYESFKKNWMLTSEQNLSSLETRDCFIQRFNRETQFSTRPWILLNGKVMFSTKVIAESLKIFQDRLAYGTYRSNNSLMKQFIHKVMDEKGKHFNKKLFNFYAELKIEKLSLFSEVKIRPGEKLKGPKDLGDIDLLLVNADTEQIICIEAKNYYEARDVYTLLDQNEKIEKDILKAERRDKWCRENILQFRNYCECVDEQYQLKTFFITYNEPAYRYFEHEVQTYLPMLSAIEIVENPFIIFEK